MRFRPGRRGLLSTLALFLGLAVVATAWNLPAACRKSRPARHSRRQRPQFRSRTASPLRSSGFARRFSLGLCPPRRRDPLLALGKQGVWAPDGMLPSFPSLTFPNHFTIVTGPLSGASRPGRQRLLRPGQGRALRHQRPRRRDRWKLVQRRAFVEPRGKPGHAFRLLLLARL